MANERGEFLEQKNTVFYITLDCFQFVSNHYCASFISALIDGFLYAFAGILGAIGLAFNIYGAKAVG